MSTKRKSTELYSSDSEVEVITPATKKAKVEFPPGDGGHLWRTTGEDDSHLQQWWFDEKSTPESQKIIDLLDEMNENDEELEVYGMVYALDYLHDRSNKDPNPTDFLQDDGPQHVFDFFQKFKNIKDVGEWHKSYDQFHKKKLNIVRFSDFASHN
jgi:hypothetical protein